MNRPLTQIVAVSTAALAAQGCASSHKVSVEKKQQSVVSDRTRLVGDDTQWQVQHTMSKIRQETDAQLRLVPVLTKTGSYALQLKVEGNYEAKTFFGEKTTQHSQEGKGQGGLLLHLDHKGNVQGRVGLNAAYRHQERHGDTSLESKSLLEAGIEGGLYIKKTGTRVDIEGIARALGKREYKNNINATEDGYAVNIGILQKLELKGIVFYLVGQAGMFQSFIDRSGTNKKGNKIDIDEQRTGYVTRLEFLLHPKDSGLVVGPYFEFTGARANKDGKVNGRSHPALDDTTHINTHEVGVTATWRAYERDPKGTDLGAQLELDAQLGWRGNDRGGSDEGVIGTVGVRVESDSWLDLITTPFVAIGKGVYNLYKKITD